ncbi:MAG: hypothetical protein O7G84_02720 [Gammaproteobacteria bacterium]|nr:hypothetical protein [Gammaproteobacteria bacterium]
MIAIRGGTRFAPKRMLAPVEGQRVWCELHCEVQPFCRLFAAFVAPEDRKPLIPWSCSLDTSSMQRYNTQDSIHSDVRRREGHSPSMKDLTDIQRRIVEVRKQRGFVTDPTKIQVLLTEEIGEISSELKRLWSKSYDEFNADRLAEEIADAFVLLSALASTFDIDLAQAVESKFFSKDSRRSWKSAE